MENKELSLIYACQAGDSQAFGEIYDKYFKKIYSFVYYKISHKESTEDLVSEIFFKAMANMKKFDTSKGSLNSWLYKIARNTVIDYYRTSKDIQNFDYMAELSSSPDLYDNLDNKMELEEIGEKLSQLNELQREVIVLRVWHQLSYKEIAQVIGKSEANSKMIFSRGIKELRLSLASLLALFTTLIN